MKIGILVSNIGNFGKKGYYNSQEIGLAKELSKIYDKIIVYKLVNEEDNVGTNTVNNYNNIIIKNIFSRRIGSNGIFKTKILDKDLDVLIYFSDTQLLVPNVYRWCKKNKILLIPYIGVISSHSNNFVKQKIINFLFYRNLKVYKKCKCIIKNQYVYDELKKIGLKNAMLSPVGIDLELLNSNYKNVDIEKIKEKYEFEKNDKILLFIGRFTEEKQPIRIIDILSEIVKINNSYKLLMVGKGELHNKIIEKIKQYNLIDNVKIIESIPNAEIYELYVMADSFINLNQQEIFGMAILEAMYYECKVIAWTAPGPNFIIENGKNGWLCDTNQNVIDKILSTDSFAEQAHERVLNEFTWKKTAENIKKFINTII